MRQNVYSPHGEMFFIEKSSFQDILITGLEAGSRHRTMALWSSGSETVHRHRKEGLRACGKSLPRRRVVGSLCPSAGLCHLTHILPLWGLRAPIRQRQCQPSCPELPGLVLGQSRAAAKLPSPVLRATHRRVFAREEEAPVPRGGGAGGERKGPSGRAAGSVCHPCGCSVIFSAP